MPAGTSFFLTLTCAFFFFLGNRSSVRSATATRHLNIIHLPDLLGNGERERETERETVTDRQTKR